MATNPDKKSLTLDELKQAFADVAAWQDIKQEGSVLCQVLKSKYLQDEECLDEISKNKLRLLALMLCAGEPKQKVQVLYTILQDSDQPYISALDKDFLSSFDLLLDMAVKLPNEYEPLVSKLP